MALMDINVQFSASQAVTATAASTNKYDLEVGLTITTTFTKSPAAIIGNATFFGEDLGAGHGVGTPVILVKNVNAANAATGTSLQVQFRGAPMNNTAFGSGNVSDLTFTPYIMSAAIPVASLLANTEIFAFDWPMRQVQTSLPRFVDLNYVVVGSNFTNLTISADLSGGADSAQQSLAQYPANY